MEKRKRNRDHVLNKMENRLHERYSREISAILTAASFVDEVRKVNQKLLKLEGLNLKLKGDLEFEDSEIDEDSSEESSFDYEVLKNLKTMITYIRISKVNRLGNLEIRRLKISPKRPKKKLNILMTIKTPSNVIFVRSPSFQGLI